MKRLIVALFLLFGLADQAAAQATVAPVPRQQFETNTGTPCASCLLYTYLAGTDTPASLYSNTGLSVAISNPVVLNSAGRPTSSGTEVNLYQPSVSYKYVLTTSGGTTIWTSDFVLPGAGSAAIPTTFVVGDLLYADTTSTLERLADVATGSVLASGGVSTAPTWSASPTLTALTAGTVTATTSVTSPSLTGAPLNIAEGRLTAVSGAPTPTTETSAGTSIYYTPYRGNRIALYDGSARWNVRSFTELTISLSGCTASTPYDVFLYDNAGTVASEILAWTNATTRATALTTQDGVYVKTGATTRRYVGTFYCNATGGQTDDTLLKRYVWNYYNRITRPVRVADATDTWTYTTSTWRQANGAAGNQVDVVVGVAEVAIDLRVSVGVSNSNAGVNVAVGIGEDATNAPATETIIGVSTTIVTTGPRQQLSAFLSKMPAVGRHFYAWIEISSATGTSTWAGDDGQPTFFRSGLSGTIEG